MGFFKLRKNKRYSYSGRFNEEKMIDGTTHQKPHKIKSKFDEYRSTIGDNNSFRNKFRNAINDYNKGSDYSVRKRLIIIFIFKIIVYYVLILLNI